VKAIILAAGYATRLRPLTDDVPKHLLPVGGRPMLDWIVEKLAAVERIDEVHLVTNGRFAPAFAAWAAGTDVRIHDDGTFSNEDRLGAIGDVQFTVEQAGLEADDLLVIAGDNLFDYALSDFVAFWAGKPEGSSAVAVHDVGEVALARMYGVVALEPDQRVVAFDEKPEQPRSTLAATATYVYDRTHVPLVRTYLAEGRSPDAIGDFIGWLHAIEPVYAYAFEGGWFDIGDLGQLLQADNQMRARSGLPLREEYSLT
jgi:glucose-1-phosphate thymidylyltransferase